MKLKIAAKIGEDDRAYFRETIEPLIDGEAVEYVGEIGEAEKADFLGNAAALVFPIDWPEPFGLVVIEAMAFGTPVIVWNEGAMPEIVDEGVTGFVVDSIERGRGRGGEARSARPRPGAGSVREALLGGAHGRDYEAIYARLAADAASARQSSERLLPA